MTITPSPCFRIVISVLMVFVAGFLFIWLENKEPSSQHQANPATRANHFYSAQASSLLDGHVDVPVAALPGECIMERGKCYGYFGITPSILRLPVVAFNPSRGLAGGFLLFAALLGMISSVLVVNEIWAQAARRWASDFNHSPWWSSAVFIMSLVAVTLGSIFYQLTQPNVYHEAIAWCVAFTTVGFWLILKWFGTGRIVYLWLAVVSMVFAANARPTAMVTAMALGVVIVILVCLDGRPWRAKVRHIPPALSLASLPFGTAVAVFMWKFHSPTPNFTHHVQMGGGNPAWAAMSLANGGKFISPEFLPTMLWAYFRPDSLIVERGSLGFAASVLVPPTPLGGYMLEPTASLTNLYPVGLLFGFLVLIFARIRWTSATRLPTPRSGFCGPWAVRGFLFALASGAILTLMNVYGSNRYLGDFVPFIVATVGFGAVLAVALLSRRTLLGRGLVVIAVALVLLGGVANLGLANSQINDRVGLVRDLLP